QSMGERFLQVRWPRPGGIEAALKAMSQDHTVDHELTQAVGDLFQALIRNRDSLRNPAISEGIMRRLAHLTEFAVRARTHIPRNGYTREIVYVPEAEAATRMAQQLAQLARGSAILAGRDEVNEEDFQLARRVGLDSIPANRRRVLDCLMKERRPWSNKELEKASGLPAAVLSRLLDDFVGLGLIAPKEGTDFEPNEIALSSEAVRLGEGIEGDHSSVPEMVTLAR